MASASKTGIQNCSNNSEIIDISNLEFSWKKKNSFSLRINKFSLIKGQSVLVVGPSGTGKSTFLNLLCGVVIPQSGKIQVLERNLMNMTSSQRDLFRAEHYGIIFQMFNLLPYGSIEDNILLPLHFSEKRRVRALESGPLHDEAQRLLKALGLNPSDIENSSASQLSVGQQQRVAAARALIGKPEIIVADEPTSALDRNRQAAFLELLFEEIKTSDTTLVMVSHDETLGSRFDTVMRLDEFAQSSREKRL